MRIFYDTTRDSIFIEGAKTVYPDRSLTASVDADDKISVRLAHFGVRVLGPVNANIIQDINGNTFADSASAKAYLDQEFAKTDRVTSEPGISSYKHNQDQPLQVWTVVHNLGRDVQVEVYVGGCIVEASVVKLDLNVLQVCFVAPQTGCVVVI